MRLPFTHSKQEPANTRTARKLCWDSRDEYFRCLDRIGVLNPNDPTQKSKINANCANEDAKFDENCATSWISYFKEKRVVDFKRARALEEVNRNVENNQQAKGSQE
ncbi:hypothetical protein NCAS_0C00710 [Naumovozyma castellii]|uniref:Cytochrome c oxidase assembly factor 6 n=1 Tax=Naumovozyma castellii TaxID=27288 RepID=G0VC54_NAUCA|nr:hypothetical protein NCAS_0C00710 [Naumovozyma castellii CBS 4309]CCC69061.1 hypothetical protein NCAS_0C00710 [Naumovozyma castellii CBS 4309]